MTENLTTATLGILFSAATFVFNFWFFLIFAPLKYRGSLLPKMAGMWVLLAALRVFLVFNPNPLKITFFLEEPLNTLLFVAAGILIFDLNILQKRRQRRAFEQKTETIRDRETLLQLTPREFEEMVVDLYEAAGHQAQRTGATGDHGVDVLVQAQNGEKWVVQCKRWRGSVGEPVVRDFYGTIQHEKADKGTLITTGKFTAQAHEWAKGKPISLYDGERFLEVWKQAQAAKSKVQEVSS
jgi:restriction system protein